VATATGGRHLHTSANSSHQSTLASVSLTRVDVTVRVKVNQLSTGASQRAGIICRYTAASDSKRADLVFDTAGGITAALVSRAGGIESTIVSESTGLTHSTSTYYNIRLQTGITSVRMKVWADGTDQPATWILDGADAAVFASPVAGRVGLFSRREVSNTNANATFDFESFSMVDGPYVRFTGFVESWPTSWADASERQSFARINASGNLRRFANSKALRSAYFLNFTNWPDTVVGYWPMEDGSTATQFSSGIGGRPFPFSGMTPAADSDVLGSDPLPVITGTGRWSFAVPDYPRTSSYSIRFLAKFPQSPASNAQIVSWTTPTGSLVSWQIAVIPGSPDQFRLEGYNAAGTATYVGTSNNFTDSTSGAELTDGRELYFSIDAVQVGTEIDFDIDVRFQPDNAPYTTTTASIVAHVTSQTIGNVATVHHDAPAGFTAGGHTMGHLAVGKEPFGPQTTAVIGYAGDSTSLRLLRFGLGAGVSTIFGDINGTVQGDTIQTMGPQESSSALDQLREIEATENGVLFDGLQGQVTILPRSLRYNRSVSFTLDHDAGQLKEGFQVDRDTQLVRNDVEVRNATGAVATASDPASIAKYGSQTLSVTINAQNDTDATQQAAWRKNLGKNPDRRYSSITLDMHKPANASLFETWLGCDIGYRFQITNLPQTYDVVDLLIDGYTETFNQSFFTVTVNASSAQPYDVWQVEAGVDNRGKVGSSGSSLLMPYDSTTTSLLVATTVADAAQWSTTGEPYDWIVSGERMRVTAMNTNVGAFVNVGTANHANNASVTPGMPAGIGKGDLLLVFCAIRNTAATITTPSGYTALISDGNVALFGKLHTGTESAPTIAFSGGAAGDDTSAQMAAFRYCQLMPVFTASVSNSSAQNIAVPAYLPPRHKVMALWLGWKQDDWTSVAVLHGQEVGEPAATAGNDQGLVWNYSYQAVASERDTSPFVVTGGASAISKGYVVAFATDVQSCTVTRSINGVAKSQTAGTAVALWRPGRVAL
jgi:hypothetical protein